MAARDRRGEPAARNTLPTGTVTLLFTDVEGSTTLLRRLGSGYGEALETHRRLLRQAFADNDGREVDTQGDSFFYAFARASDAVRAAEAAQRALARADWPGRVRMGLHTGEPLLGREGYVGLDVHLAARICDAAHGGQVLLSAATGDLAPDVDSRDLGLHRLRDIEQPQRIFQLGAGEFPPPRTARATNLPSPANRLIGRERELARALESLRRADVRLLTLTGPGGAGKSRLALEIAAVLGEERRDGVQLVPLAPLADATLVPSAIARVVGAREPTLSAVVDVLVDSDRLLLLDNVEHVAAAAPAFAELVAGAPGVTLLTTSRAPLRVLGEHVLLVPPLGEGDAAVLFAERAAAVGHAVPPGSEHTVRELCRRLDHLPLAIELAAARVPLLGVEMLLERLSLALLSDGPRDLPERQRTLRSTIDWSYGLLTPTQRLLHQCLAVFPGGCTLAAAEEICEIGDLVGELGVLLDGSLLLRDDDRRGGPRIRQLETVREYAVEAAREGGVLDDLRRRQASWVLGLAEEAEEGLGGPHQADWLERLELELPNLRAAVAWALESDEAERALRIAAALGRFWRAHGHASEARKWLEQGLTATGVADDVRASALWTAAWLAIGQSDHDSAEPYLEEARVLFDGCGNAPRAVFSLCELAHVAHRRGDAERAVALASEAVDAAQQLGDPRTTSGAVNALASILSERGDFARARPLLEEALSLRRTLGNPMLVANSAYNLGVAALHEGELDRAAEALEEALALARASGDRYYSAYSLCMLGEIAFLGERPEQAEPLLRESLGLLEEMGDDRSRAECLHALAAVAGAEGRLGEAEMLAAEAAELRGDATLLPWEAAIDAALASTVRHL
ncbi:MAG TPA: tetratricopeptide repeat protein [Gaiellaceae bacterium]|nr:tetratricopeptide repeat protein [Gaiellaceae bacterium]